ncbi:MAG: RsmG family class I SAM-dependent methyltransferase [Hyphomicrobiales bacterium]
MARASEVPTIDSSKTFAEVFKVPRETIHKLTRFAELLEHWQKSTNLVAASTLPELWSRHFADSAQLHNLAPDARLWLDLGSGAGFPGLVDITLAIWKRGLSHASRGNQSQEVRFSIGGSPHS